MNLAEKQMSLTDQVRKSVDRLTNRYDGSQYISLEAALKDFNEKMDRIAVLEDKAAACTCQAAPGFEINTRRNNGMLDAQLTTKRLKSQRAAEQLNGWDDVFATVKEHQSTGEREGAAQ